MANDRRKTRGSLLERHKRLGMALQDPRTTKGDCVVLSVISEHSDHAGNCWPGLELIARKAGVSRSSVIRATRTLESLGYLKIEKESGKSNYYILADTGSIPDTGTRSTDDTGLDDDQLQGCHPRGGTDDTPPVSSMHKTRVMDDTRTQLELSSRNSIQITQGAAPAISSLENQKQGQEPERSPEEEQRLRARARETYQAAKKLGNVRLMESMEANHRHRIADLIEDKAA